MRFECWTSRFGPACMWHAAPSPHAPVCMQRIRLRRLLAQQQVRWQHVFFLLLLLLFLCVWCVWSPRAVTPLARVPQAPASLLHPSEFGHVDAGGPLGQPPAAPAPATHLPRGGTSPAAAVAVAAAVHAAAARAVPARLDAESHVSSDVLRERALGRSASAAASTAAWARKVRGSVTAGGSPSGAMRPGGLAAQPRAQGGLTAASLGAASVDSGESGSKPRRAAAPLYAWEVGGRDAFASASVSSAASPAAGAASNMLHGRHVARAREAATNPRWKLYNKVGTHSPQRRRCIAAAASPLHRCASVPDQLTLHARACLQPLAAECRSTRIGLAGSVPTLTVWRCRRCAACAARECKRAVANPAVQAKPTARAQSSRWPIDGVVKPVRCDGIGGAGTAKAVTALTALSAARVADRRL